MQEFRRGLYDSDATDRQLANVSQELEELTTIVKTLETHTAQDQQVALDTARRLERMEQSLERLSMAVDPKNQEQHSRVEEKKAQIKELITFFIGAVAGGIIGNRADAVFMTVVESLQQKPIPTTPQPNHVTPKPEEKPKTPSDIPAPKRVPQPRSTATPQADTPVTVIQTECVANPGQQYTHLLLRDRPSWFSGSTNRYSTKRGEKLEIKGKVRSDDDLWLEVQAPDGSRRYVSSQICTTDADLDSIPDVSP